MSDQHARALDEQLTLEQIDGQPWGEPPPDATRLIQAAYDLRRVPVGELTVEDLRLLIGQELNLGILVPLALRALGDDPLAEGDLYPGDLLIAVLRTVPASYWGQHPQDRARMDAVVTAAVAAANDPDDDRMDAGDDQLGPLAEAFRSA